MYKPENSVLKRIRQMDTLQNESTTMFLSKMAKNPASFILHDV